MNKANPGYNRYGGRGIRFLLSKEDMAQLWYRDNAANLLEPSLGRIDSNGDYSINNCRFLEVSDASRRRSFKHGYASSPRP